MKGVIIDGISTTGKSTILSLVHARLHTSYPHSSKIFLSEHYTQRMLENRKEAGTLTASDIKNHYAHILSSLQSYEDMLKVSKFSSFPGNAELFVTLERGLFSYFVNEVALVDEYGHENIAYYLKTLTSLHIRHLFLVISESFLTQRIESSLLHRNTYRKEYIESLGGVKNACDFFLSQQALYLSLFRSFSGIVQPVLMDIHDNNYQSYADKVYSYFF